MTTILDGLALAARRTESIAHRAAGVQRRHGRAPRLLIVAFEDDRGEAPHVVRKIRAGEAAGMDIELLRIGPGTAAVAAVAQLDARVGAGGVDGVFVQFPFPPGFDGDALVAAIPVDLDVDVMTPARIDRFMSGEEDLPPVTVAAGLLLLDAYGVSIAGRRGIVIAEEGPFPHMFREALTRRGARMLPLVPPDAAAIGACVQDAELVVVAAAAPGVVKSALLRPGAVAIDVGYFNPGGRGDIDVAGGVAQLAAFAPVPGGIGPLTVSALLERVVLFAERSDPPTVRHPVNRRA